MNHASTATAQTTRHILLVCMITLLLVERLSNHRARAFEPDTPYANGIWLVNEREKSWVRDVESRCGAIAEPEPPADRRHRPPYLLQRLIPDDDRIYAFADSSGSRCHALRDRRSPDAPGEACPHRAGRDVPVRRLAGHGRDDARNQPGRARGRWYSARGHQGEAVLGGSLVGRLQRDSGLQRDLVRRAREGEFVRCDVKFYGHAAGE